MQPSASKKPNTERGALLLALARDAINQAMDLPRSGASPTPDLATNGACFVTLRINGELRGCIGSLEAHRPLAADLEANARAAALDDPRFPPLSRREWRQTELEVSELSAIEWRDCPNEEDARAWIRPGEDGVVLAASGHRATFLPQVWRQLPEFGRFFAELRRKAGLPVDRWPADMRVGRYRVSAYEETPR